MSGRIVEHHIKYVETHGYDETIFITDTEHQRINHRILFPMVDSEQLAKISRDAYKRSEKAKELKRNRIRSEIIAIASVDLKAAITEKRII